MRRRRDERGVTMIVMAGMISVLVLFVAIVIDLGSARSADQVNDAVVDDAALAGAAQLDDGNAEAACEMAWAYIQANETATPLDPPCGNLAGSCVATSARTAAIDVGDTRYTFVSPVPDSNPLITAQPRDSEVEQDPCDRFAVTVDEVSDNTFSTGSIEVRSSAVAAQTPGTPGTTSGGGGAGPAPIVILDPTGCNVLSGTGSGSVRALARNGNSGVIHVDSDGSDCDRKNEAVVEGSGGPQAGIYVDGPDGAVNMFALGKVAPATAVRESGSASVQGATPAAERHGRKPVDDRYGSAIADLAGRWGGSGKPDGFRRWTDYMAQTRPFVDDPCNISGGTDWTNVPMGGKPYPFDVPVGDWYIDCPNGLKFGGDGYVVFRGGNFVMERPLDISGSVPFALNCPSGSLPRYKQQFDEMLSSCGTITGDSTIVVRRGDAFEISGSNPMVLPRTFVYSPGGTFDVGSGKSVSWTAPLGGPFEDLLFWSESTAPLALDGGHLDVALEGVLFAPNAVMNVGGSRKFTNQGLQTFLKQLHVDGSGSFEVYPLPDRHVSPGSSTPAGPDGVSLIR